MEGKGKESYGDRLWVVAGRPMGYRYGGKDYDRTETVARLQEEIPSLEKTVVILYLREEPDTSDLKDVVLWDELLAAHEGADLEFEQLPSTIPCGCCIPPGYLGRSPNFLCKAPKGSKPGFAQKIAIAQKLQSLHKNYKGLLMKRGGGRLLPPSWLRR